MEKKERTDPDRPKSKDEGRLSRQLSSCLSDISFRKAVVRLVHHVQEESGGEFTAETAAECLERLALISFQEVPCVKTVMMKENKKPLGRQILCYVHNKEGKSRESVVYLDADACLDPDSYMDGFLLKLVSAIQFVLEVRVDGLLLYHMLKCPRQANRILDEAGIQEYDTVDQDSFSSASTRPGNFVPLCYHTLLDNDFHEFCEGEYVAFEVYDPLEVCEDSEYACPVYLYAIVLHEICDGVADTIFAKRYCIDLGPDRGEADVSITRLYKIKNKTEVQIKRQAYFLDKGEQNIAISKEKIDQKHDVTQISNASPDDGQEEVKSSKFKEKDALSLDTFALLKDLREMLTKAWQVCREQEFRCVTKRLAKKWHPDSHSANSEAVCTHLTQAIFCYAELLSKGKNLDQGDYPVGDTLGDSIDGRVAGIPAKYFSTRHNAEWGLQQEGYGWENPQPGEGRRWLRTAQCDLAAAKASRGVCPQGRNWVCFLCHQAVEKALKGLLYMRDADSKVLQSHSLPLLARHSHDTSLTDMAKELESRMGPHTRMRYPDVLVYPKIPADVYSDDHVDWACRLAWDALERVKELMNI